MRDEAPKLGQIGKLSWVNAIFLTAVPLITIGSAIYYISHYGVHWFEPVLFVIMYILSGLSITGGYHRLFAHQAYQAHPVLKAFYLCFGAAAVQNSVLKWASDHRSHHRYVDRDGDPYNIKRGFFWAHMGWIFYGDPEGRTFDNAKDLERDRLVAFQHRYYLPITIFFGALLPLFIGWCFGRPMGGLLWGGLLRVVVQQHSTFLINSWAHYFGRQPYSEGGSARDSFTLALLSFGEGYHNYHHTYASDYRNGVRWWQWDPSKWFIYVGSFVGLTWNLQRVPDSIWMRARMQKAHLEWMERLALASSRASHKISADLHENFEAAKAHLDKAFRDFQEVRNGYRKWKKDLKRRPRTERPTFANLKLEWKERLAQARVSWVQARTEYFQQLQRVRRSLATA